MRYVWILGAFLMVPSASVSATMFTDEASWTASMSSTTAVTLPTNASGNSISAGDLTFTKSGSATNLLTGPSADYWSTIIPGIDLAISAPEDVTVTFGTAVTGFSFLLHEPSLATGGKRPPDPDTCNTGTCVDTTFKFKLFNGATILDEFSLNPADDIAQFVGFSSGTAFDKVVIDDFTNHIDNEYFGAFKTGVAAVPLPASLPLFAAGIGVFGWAARRNQRKPQA